MPEVTKCPPAAAKGATLHPWQFGATQFGVADPGTARRLATGALTPCEQAVRRIVLEQPGDIAQRDLQALLASEVGDRPWAVYNAAQRLAKHGMICRKMFKRHWHYAKPGFVWPKKPVA